MTVNEKNTKLCAFCIYFQDYMRNAIKPKAGGLVEIDKTVRCPCKKHNNSLRYANNCCAYFERR